ncbi:MAG TPA: hypothetical protein VHW09_27490 [Bryobacteraceae bacterium]|jgi:hypothetical protein|nr:hypothetical protein [Bryobacteraceae bacterium]
MKYEIQKPAAVFAIALLAAIVGFCPVLLCAPPGTENHSCCPHSGHRPAPRDASSQACPYFLLEKAQPAPLPLAVLPPVGIARLAPSMQCESVSLAPSNFILCTDLYLRNRVLLI